MSTRRQTGRAAVIDTSSESRFGGSALEEIWSEVDALARLEEDWNDEGAPPVDPVVIRRAKDVLRLMDRESPRNVCNLPAVYPTVDGGVQLHWTSGTRQILLTFAPGQKRIRLSEKRPGSPSVHRDLTDDQAAAAAGEAMCDA